MPYVFISYVRENTEAVDRLYQELISRGIKVWLDRNNIAPGTRWGQAIRRAIRQGTFFIACFSKEYNERDKTYMNEELTLAIDELRQRPTDRVWFIPVKLNACEIPDRDIGGGETLQDLQYVELYKDWNAGVQRILKAIHPESSESVIDENNVERDFDEFVLLRPEDGRLYFVPVQDARWDSTEISLELLPESSEEAAFLRSLRSNRRWILGFALQEDAAWVSPQEVVQTMSSSQTVWKVVLKEDSGGQGFSFLDDDVTFGSISPDQIAEMRARRILLDEKLEELPKNFQNQTGFARLANQAMLESFIRGQTKLKVLESPIPHLYRSFGRTVERFRKFAHLASVLYLKLSNTVEDILQLDLELLNQRQLQVRFKGRRRQRAVNVEPSNLEVNGICSLSE